MLKNKDVSEAVVLEGPSTWVKPEAPIQAEAPMPKARKPRSPKVMERKFEVNNTDGLGRLLDTYLNGVGRKSKHNYFAIEGSELVHNAPDAMDSYRAKAEARSVIAKKINGEFIGNSSILPQVGRHCAYGSIQPNRGETEIQRLLARHITMVPFTAFSEAKLDINKLKVIEKGKAETVKRRVSAGWNKGYTKQLFKIESAHYTGAALFEIDGKCFLFDIDRKELVHRIFNAFLVELPCKVKSIAEAYEALKPEAVKKAEKTKRVLRQGEFFFIPVSKAEASRIAKHPKVHCELELRVGPNRPNKASKGIQFDDRGKPIGGTEDLFSALEAQGVDWDRVNTLRDKLGDLKNIRDTFVTGKIEHTGREHKDIVLRGWYRVVPNTAIRSFTLRGDVD